MSPRASELLGEALAGPRRDWRAMLQTEDLLRFLGARRDEAGYIAYEAYRDGLSDEQACALIADHATRSNMFRVSEIVARFRPYIAWARVRRLEVLGHVAEPGK